MAKARALTSKTSQRKCAASSSRTMSPRYVAKRCREGNGAYYDIFDVRAGRGEEIATVDVNVVDFFLERLNA